MSIEDRYIIRGGLEGRERLRVLGRAMHPTTAALFDRIGLAPGMTCLDVGCGGGDVTCELARRPAPGGRAVGIELDAAKVAIAREEAEADGGLAVEYREGDVLTTEFAPDHDVIYVRFLLTHLVDPAWATARIAAGLGPNGVDPNIGPRLPQLLIDAGCERVGVNVVQPAGMTAEGQEGTSSS